MPGVTLGFEDTVEDRLPGLMEGGDTITVEMLLRLRSGLPDYIGPLFGDPPTDASALDRHWSPAQLVAVALTSSDRLPPDTQFRYCNADYILLGPLSSDAPFVQAALAG